MEKQRQRAVCLVSDGQGRVDVLPYGHDGVAVRIVSPDASAVAKALRSQQRDPDRAPVLGRISIETPRPRIAVIIDDLGLRPGMIRRFWTLGQPLTWSIIPGSKYAAKYASWLRERGASVLVHLPLEPEVPKFMTLPGFITLAQPSRERARLVREAFAGVEGAIGLNNHMGSRFTADRAAVASLLDGVPPGSIVVDSRTTPATVLEELAKRRFATARRSVFLDNERQTDAIYEQLQEAFEIARKRGYALAIGHAYPETAVALRQFVIDYRDRMHIVPVEHVVTPTTAPRWLRDCEAVLAED